MKQIDEAPELLVFKAFIHSVSFFQNAFLIIRLFDFDERKRQPVDEQRDVGAEFLVAVFAGQFRHDMQRVVPEFVEINQFDARRRDHPLEKRFPQILVVEFQNDGFQRPRDVVVRDARIEAAQALRKNVGEDIGAFVSRRLLKRQIRISQPA